MKDRGEKIELPVTGIITSEDLTNPKTSREYEKKADDLDNKIYLKFEKDVNAIVGKKLKQDVYDKAGKLIASQGTIVDKDLAVTLVKMRMNNKKYLRSSLFASGARTMAKIVKVGSKVVSFGFTAISLTLGFAVPGLVLTAVSALGVVAAGYSVISSVIAKKSRAFLRKFERIGNAFTPNKAAA